MTAINQISAAIIAPEKIEEFVKAGQEQAQKHFEEAASVTKEHLGKAQEQLTKGYEEFSAFSKGNVDAVVASTTIVVKAAEEFSKTYASLSKAYFEKYVTVSKAVLSAKSLNEVSAISSDFAKSNYESLVAEAGKLQELSVQVANDALAPLSARFNVAVEKFAKPLAA